MDPIFDWEQVEQALAAAEPFDDDGDVRREVFVGTVFTLLPSGKYYTPWACGNVEACADGDCGKCEACRDTDWHEQAEAECEAHNCYLTAGEGDPCDLFIGRVTAGDGELSPV